MILKTVNVLGLFFIIIGLLLIIFTNLCCKYMRKRVEKVGIKHIEKTKEKAVKVVLNDGFEFLVHERNLKNVGVIKKNIREDE